MSFKKRVKIFISDHTNVMISYKWIDQEKHKQLQYRLVDGGPRNSLSCFRLGAHLANTRPKKRRTLVAHIKEGMF